MLKKKKESPHYEIQHNKSPPTHRASQGKPGKHLHIPHVWKLKIDEKLLIGIHTKMGGQTDFFVCLFVFTQNNTIEQCS